MSDDVPFNAPYPPEEPSQVSGGPDMDLTEMRRESRRWSDAWEKVNKGPRMNPENSRWLGTSGSHYHGLTEDLEKRIRDVFGKDLTDERVLRIFRMQCELTHAITNGKAANESYVELLKAIENLLGPVIVDAIGDQYI
jgi:hypothetical protein